MEDDQEDEFKKLLSHYASNDINDLIDKLRDKPCYDDLVILLGHIPHIIK